MSEIIYRICAGIARKVRFAVPKLEHVSVCYASTLSKVLVTPALQLMLPSVSYQQLGQGKLMAEVELILNLVTSSRVDHTEQAQDDQLHAEVELAVIKSLDGQLLKESDATGLLSQNRRILNRISFKGARRQAQANQQLVSELRFGALVVERVLEKKYTFASVSVIIEEL